jgi:hypothetical protein
MDNLGKAEPQPSLWQRVVQAFHPNGIVRQSMPVTYTGNAVPAGGTAAAQAALSQMKRQTPLKEYVSPDGKQRDWFPAGEAPEGWNAVAGSPHLSMSKTLPVPGDQLPRDAVGPNGEPIPAERRNAQRAYVQQNGVWYEAPQPKPVYRIIKGHVALMDPKTGLPMRDLGPASAVKFTTRQEPYLGDDQQMHLMTLTTVTTPQGEAIEVEAPPPEQPAAATQAQTGSAVKKGTPAHVLRNAAAQGMAPAIPGSHLWAASKNPLVKADITTYQKLNADAAQKELLAKNAQDLLNDKNRVTDLDLVFMWVRSNIQGAGRMTNTEIQQAAKAGSLGTRAQSALQQALHGRLAPQVEQQFLNDIQRAAVNARQQAEQMRQGLGQGGTASGQSATPKVWKYNPATGRLE